MKLEQLEGHRKTRYCGKYALHIGSVGLFLVAFLLGFLLFLLLGAFFFPVVDDVEEVINRTVPLFPSLINCVLELHCSFLFANIEEEGLFDEPNSPLIEFSKFSD